MDDKAVDRFAAAMKAKLAQKRGEGRGGWQDPKQCSGAFLSQLLREHVDKGDPLDVGNLAMMLHQRSERIAPAPKAEAVEPIAWLRDLDGTGSLHACAKGDPGAIAVYTSPVPAITDEAVERAAKAIHDGPLGASDEEDFGDNKASDWCREVARAALLAAFPSKGEGE